MAKNNSAGAPSLNFLKGSSGVPGKDRVGTFSYSKVSCGLDEAPYDPDDKVPGDNSANSERARSASKESFINGCFCNKRGQ